MIRYKNGDATKPIGSDPKVIFHVVNDQGVWDTGFALTLSNTWPEPESHYRAWHESNDRNTLVPLEMGEVQIVPIKDDLWVLNVCAIGHKNGRLPIRYEKLNECLQKVAQFCKLVGASAYTPKIDTGLGDWDVIEPMIIQCLYAIDVVICE